MHSICFRYSPNMNEKKNINNNLNCLHIANRQRSNICVYSRSLYWISRKWTRRFHDKSILFSPSFDYGYYRCLFNDALATVFFVARFTFYVYLCIIINKMYRINCHYNFGSIHNSPKRKPFFFVFIIHHLLHLSQWSKRVLFKLLLHKHFVPFDQMIITIFQLNENPNPDTKCYWCVITLSDPCIDVIISIQLNNIWALMISWATGNDHNKIKFTKSPQFKLNSKITVVD